MKVEKIKKDNCIVELKFDVPYEEVAKDLNNILGNVKNKVDFPGFRKGHAPTNLIKKKFSKYIEQEMLEEKVPKLVKDYITEKKFKIISEVTYNDIDFKENEPLTFSVEFEIYPEFELKPEDYKGITVPKLDSKVSKEDIDNEIEKIQKKNAEYKSVNRKIKKDDLVYVDMNNYLDGQELEKYNMKNFSFTVRKAKKSEEKQMIEIVSDAIIGKKADDEVEVKYTFPKDISDSNVAGKEIDIKVKINKAEEVILPDVDDELAKEANYESAKDMKDKIKENLEKQKETETETKNLDNIFNKIISKIEMEVPSTFVKSYNKSLLARLERNLYYQGMNLDNYFQYTNTTREKWLEQNNTESVKEVKKELIINKIAELENIKAERKEISKKLEDYSKTYKKDKTELKRYLINNNLWNGFKDDIVNDKVIEFLKNNVKHA